MGGALDDFMATEALRRGDPCEWRAPASFEWRPGTVVINGGGGVWSVRAAAGDIVDDLYVEHVRAPGTDPWDR